jgi:adenylate kinase family enzyme
VPFYELDAINHQAGWVEPDADALRERVAALIVQPAWVIDGAYRGKLGDLVLEHADTVVWLDLPRRVWLPRLVSRTLSGVVRRETLGNGNRERLRTALVGRDALLAYALCTERSRRQRDPRELARFRVARLRTRAEVDAFVRSAARREGGTVSDTVRCQGHSAPNA